MHAKGEIVVSNRTPFASGAAILILATLLLALRATAFAGDLEAAAAKCSLPGVRREHCLMDSSRTTGDPGYCRLIERPAGRDGCLSTAAQLRKDARFCRAIRGAAAQARCATAIAVARADPSACAALAGEARQACEGEVRVAKLCAALVDFKRRRCADYVRKHGEDAERASAGCLQEGVGCTDGESVAARRRGEADEHEFRRQVGVGPFVGADAAAWTPALGRAGLFFGQRWRGNFCVVLCLGPGESMAYHAAAGLGLGAAYDARAKKGGWSARLHYYEIASFEAEAIRLDGRTSVAAAVGIHVFLLFSAKVSAAVGSVRGTPKVSLEIALPPAPLYVF